MNRITLRIPDEQREALETLVEAGRYPNRSEAIRAAIRDLTADELDAPDDADPDRPGRPRALPHER